jgi:hypothetical protein
VSVITLVAAIHIAGLPLAAGNTLPPQEYAAPAADPQHFVLWRYRRRRRHIPPPQFLWLLIVGLWPTISSWRHNISLPPALHAAAIEISAANLFSPP